MVTLGIKAGGLSRERDYLREIGVPTTQMLEALPATRIRLTELRTSAQLVVTAQLYSATIWSDPRKS
jgi:hypothetical protein